jgi:polyhydroxyalkanoate synthesis regulator phasin
MKIPGVGSMLPDKTALLEQGQKLVADLTSMKSSGKLNAADTQKVDSMLPKANALNTELAKPQVEPSKLTQLAGQLGDLQKQVSALQGKMK